MDLRPPLSLRVHPEVHGGEQFLFRLAVPDCNLGEWLCTLPVTPHRPAGHNVTFSWYSLYLYPLGEFIAHTGKHPIHPPNTTATRLCAGEA